MSLPTVTVEPLYNPDQPEIKTRKIPMSEAAQIAVDVLRTKGELELGFNEVFCTYGFIDSNRLSYTAPTKILGQIRLLAQERGLTVEEKNEYAGGQLIGHDYGLSAIIFTTKPVDL